MRLTRYERDCIADYGYLPEDQEEIDPQLASLAGTPEGEGLRRHSESTVKANISDLVAELANPMTENLREALVAELCVWMEIHRGAAA